MKNNLLTILSGAGISVESGLKTFRGEGGLWEGYDIMKVASIEGWREDPELVLDFYNKRRAQLSQVQPNTAHKICVDLESLFEVHVVTQNVDDLHERAGSKNVLHLHGELKKVKSSLDPSFVIPFEGDQKLGDLCPNGSQMRPDVVWFGEAVPRMEDAAMLVANSQVIIIVGTSLQVYPAAGLVSYAQYGAQIFYIDPDPQVNFELARIPHLHVISKGAEVGMREVYKMLQGRIQ